MSGILLSINPATATGPISLLCASSTVLKPGFKKLKNLTNVPVIGTIPLVSLNLPEEDSLNAKPKHIAWSKKNILKIDDELNKLSKTVYIFTTKIKR